MTLADVTVLSGVVWAVSCCGVTMRTGDKPERGIAALLMGFWIVTTPLQFLLHDIYGVGLVAHCAFGVCLLWLAARYHRPWIWVMTALAAVLFFMHAILYQPSRPPVLGYLVATDVIVWGGPLFLAAVALRHRHGRNRRGRAPVAAAAAADVTPWAADPESGDPDAPAAFDSGRLEPVAE
ncbi:MAG: hypothetical protein WA840_05785 [Caulobacteraceae bacterium]